MDDDIYIIGSNHLEKKPFEIVEKKGSGHPDTLADRLAELLSVCYSTYTKKKYGAVLHHNFDKLSLLGGSAFVTFGKGYLTSPIRVVLNGRASVKFGKQLIQVEDMLKKWTMDFFKQNLYGLNISRDLRFIYELSNQSSPGKTYSKELIKTSARKFWFEPRTLDDLPELKRLFSNDTSLGVGYAPLSSLEKFVNLLERYLTSQETRRKIPWMGTDIKIMAAEINKKVLLTICIPQIADFVSSIGEYRKNKQECLKIFKHFSKNQNIDLADINLNTRDNEEIYEIYLTATGSSIESGDEGVVGRGNRVNGLISPLNPYSMEGVCGKNPVYHIGKLYYLAANLLAQKIYNEFGISNQVFLASQSGRDLLDPWLKIVCVPVSTSEIKIRKIKLLVGKFLRVIPSLTEEILSNKFDLF